MLVIGLFLAAVRHGGAADTRIALTPELISRWIADLGSDSRAVRSAAEAALIAQGSAVIEMLPGESNLDPSIRESLDRIIRTIEQTETASALLPRQVQLPGRSLVECRDAIWKETGNRVGLPENRLPDLTQSPPQEPMSFWQSIDWIEAHSGNQYRGKSISTGPSESGSPVPVHLQGPFRVQLLDHSIRRSPDGRRLLGIKLRIESEPRLRPLFLMAAVDGWQATLGEQVLLPFTPGARRELSADRTGETEVSYDFLIPDQTVSGKLSLKGEVDQTLSARTVQVTFSDLQAHLPLVRRRGQVSLSLLSIRMQDQQTWTRLALAFPESRGLFESYRSSLLSPELSLIRQDGSIIKALETSQIQEDPDGNILEVRFGTANLRNTRLTAQIPTAISTQTVRFAFSDITQEDLPDRQPD